MSTVDTRPVRPGVWGRVETAARSTPPPEGDGVYARLQHLTDPVRALAQMRRVCRPGGTVAVRDSDYAGFTWFPAVPGLDDWLRLYRQAARRNGGEPDAGRRLLSWARAAGFRDMVPSAGVWCFATAEDRQWWGRSWADRVRYSDFARQLRDDDRDRIADAWLTWAEAPDGWFGVLHGELICHP